jgi:hypothetical protein
MSDKEEPKSESTAEEIDVLLLEILLPQHTLLPTQKGIHRLSSREVLAKIVAVISKRKRERKALFQTDIAHCVVIFEQFGFCVPSKFAEAVVAHCAEAYADGIDGRINGKRGKGQRLREPPDTLVARIDALRQHLNRLPSRLANFVEGLVYAAYQRGWNDGCASKVGRGRPKKTFDEEIIDLLTTPEPDEKGGRNEKKLQRARKKLAG